MAKKTRKAPVKKRKNSRAKGKTYERLIAKVLGEWWGEPFRSTPGSGALHWEKDSRVTGDIVPPVDSEFPFTVECKKREGWYFDSIINETGEIKDWWEQSITDAARVDKEPVLIFSKNRAPSYVMLDLTTFKKLKLHHHPYIECFMEVTDGRQRVGITKLDTFTAITKKKIMSVVG